MSSSQNLSLPEPIHCLHWMCNKHFKLIMSKLRIYTQAHNSLSRLVSSMSLHHLTSFMGQLLVSFLLPPFYSPSCLILQKFLSNLPPEGILNPFFFEAGSDLTAPALASLIVSLDCAYTNSWPDGASSLASL